MGSFFGVVILVVVVAAVSFVLGLCQGEQQMKKSIKEGKVNMYE